MLGQDVDRRVGFENNPGGGAAARSKKQDGAVASQNFFALLGDVENEDPTALIERASLSTPVEKAAAKKQQQHHQAPAKLPSKPTPQAETVKDAHRGQYEGGRGGRGGGGHGDREREGGPRREGGRGYYGDRDREGGTAREGGSNRQRGTYNNDDRGHSNNYNNSRENDGHWGGRGAYGGGSSGYGDKPSRGEDGEARSLEGSRARGRGGGGRGGYGAEGEERPRRTYDRLSGSGRGHEMKKEGSGSNNWGTIGGQAVQATAEEIVKEEEISVPFAEEKKPDEETKPEAQVEEVVEEKVQKEPDEMTLEEYQKIREEKRKTLEANKSEERKVEVDKAFKSMQLVEKKKEDDVFIKLGDDKGKLKKKEMEKEKEERARKVVSINEFLKPAEGDKYHGSGGGRGHGRGEGRGDRRGNFAAGGGSYNARNVSAPHIEDPGQFPTLGGK